MSHRVLRIVALMAAMIAAPLAAGRVYLEPKWLDLLASAAIGVVTGLTVLFIFKRLPIDESKDS